MMFKIAAWACLITLALSNQTYAVEGEFITIIGPDGRPMVVPFLDKKKQTSAVASKQQQTILESSKKTESITFKNVETTTEQHNSPSIQVRPQDSVKEIEQAKVETTQQSQTNNNELSTATKPEVVKQQVIAKPVVVEEKTIDKQKVLPSKPPNNNINQAQTTQVQASVDTEAEDLPYRMVDGEKYYESEYLESKEFNLEQKKRFYQIPGLAGGSNWDIVEREKGADMSFFNPTQKQTAKSQEIIALGSAYKVLEKDELSQALPLQCVDQKAQKKAKSLVIDKTLSLWPRAPFHDRFDYQLVKLDQPIENMKIFSYADRLDNPTYYWPMMVFLDEQGCITEGASAFSTEMNAATMLQNASIEGVIHIPKYSKFIMLVPLEQAVDVPELKLSNQGQIDLKVLR